MTELCVTEQFIQELLWRTFEITMLNEVSEEDADEAYAYGYGEVEFSRLAIPMKLNSLPCWQGWARARADATQPDLDEAKRVALSEEKRLR